MLNASVSSAYTTRKASDIKEEIEEWNPVVTDTYLVFTDSHPIVQNLQLIIGTAAERSSWNSGTESEMEKCRRSYCSNVRRVVNPITRFLQMVKGERAVVH